MNWLTGAFATCGFELRRSFTFQRTAVSVVLAIFPPTMLGLLVFGALFAESRGVEGGTVTTVIQEVARLLILFMVSLVCLLSLMLWATPNVHSELEGKSWSFIASRPGGRISIFLGKFLAAFFVAFCISLIAISLCVLIASRMLKIPNPEQLWVAMVGVYLIACCVYSAVFSMMGTMFIKRAMIVAAGYLFVSDIILASIPGALINKLTLRYHLQEIGISWIGWFLGANEPDYRAIYGAAWPTWIHVAVLAGIALVTLGIGCWVIVNREYVISDES